MPHIQIDYTANLADAVIGGRLVDKIHQAAVDSGIFPVWGIRTFARPLSEYGSVAVSINDNPDHA